MTLRARDLMETVPVVLAPDTPFLEAQRLLVEAHVGGAPVVGDDGQILGVVSCSDLLRVVDQICDDEIDLDPDTLASRSKLPPDAPELTEELRSLTALDVASPAVVWVHPDTEIARVAGLMRREGIHRVLVGSDGQIAGILTAFDLLKAL